MFPSPVGELHFSIENAIPDELIEEFVSVPCRGTTFLNRLLQIRESMMLLFPSPVGELHFSMGVPGTPGTDGKTPFPSPVGELHFSI